MGATTIGGDLQQRTMGQKVLRGILVVLAAGFVLAVVGLTATFVALQVA